MTSPALSLRDLEHRVTAWAAAQSDIRAAAVVGSQARTDHPADDWSDLDIVVIATEPAPYLADPGWLAALGPVCTSIVTRTAGGEPERLVLFDGGLNVDVVFQTVAHAQAAARGGVTPDGFRRGVRVLIDKDGLLVPLVPQRLDAPAAPGPTPEEFHDAVAAFWYLAFYLAKQLRRGELWLVKVREHDRQRLLLRMLEWHARATHGARHDTWHLGRFLDEWADPRAAAALAATFSRYDTADGWRALSAAMALVHWLARETADRLGYAYPTAVEACVTGLVAALRPPDLTGPVATDP